MGAVLAGAGPITQGPRNARGNFSRDPQALNTRAHLLARLVLTLWSPEATVGDVRKTGRVPFPITKAPFPWQHVGVNWLGLKPHETRHLAPDSLPPPPQAPFQ